MENEIRSILEAAYPLTEPEGQKAARQIEINGNRNFVFYNTTSLVFLVILFLIVFFIPFKNERIITGRESEQLKEFVSNVAACEGKSRMTIHNELKRKYNYHTYKEIHLSTYKNVLSVLKQRSCFYQKI